MYAITPTFPPDPPCRVRFTLIRALAARLESRDDRYYIAGPPPSWVTRPRFARARRTWWLRQYNAPIALRESPGLILAGGYVEAREGALGRTYAIRREGDRPHPGGRITSLRTLYPGDPPDEVWSVYATDRDADITQKIDAWHALRDQAASAPPGARLEGVELRAGPWPPYPVGVDDAGRIVRLLALCAILGVLNLAWGAPC